MKEVSTELLPIVDEREAEHGGTLFTYGIYAEETREAFTNLSSAVGLPKVRELD